MDLENSTHKGLFFVLDKPPPPSGDVVITDVKADNVSMAWSPPIDHSETVEEYVIEAKGRRKLSTFMDGCSGLTYCSTSLM